METILVTWQMKDRECRNELSKYTPKKNMSDQTVSMYLFEKFLNVEIIIN